MPLDIECHLSQGPKKKIIVKKKLKFEKLLSHFLNK